MAIAQHELLPAPQPEITEEALWPDRPYLIDLHSVSPLKSTQELGQQQIDGEMLALLTISHANTTSFFGLIIGPEQMSLMSYDPLNGSFSKARGKARTLVDLRIDDGGVLQAISKIRPKAGLYKSAIWITTAKNTLPGSGRLRPVG